MRYSCLLFCLFLLSNCSPKKAEIFYGEDKCAFCKMTIVDRKFGCEIVTGKGRVYKFDAVECMINHYNAQSIQPDDIYGAFTNTTDEPTSLIQVENCTFLQSEQLPSPMGMYINAFAKAGTANNFYENYDGHLYTWNELVNAFQDTNHSIHALNELSQN